MDLHLKRRWFNANAVIGEIFIDGNAARECYTLEAPAVIIPIGTYEVILNYSNRFQRVMPLLLNVPHREGIRIHSGNTDKDTEGCILVGRVPVNDDFIGESRAAFSSLYDQMTLNSQHGKIMLDIVDDPLEKGTV